MQGKGQLDLQLHDPEFRRLYQEEKLIVDATELISGAMKEKEVSRADLARLLGRTRGFVTQILSGSRNLTLRTLADAMTVLGSEIRMSREPLELKTLDRVEWQPVQCRLADEGFTLPHVAAASELPPGEMAA